MNEIHPSAIVEKGAELDGVFVGPFCHVGSGVKLGRGTRLISHCSVVGDTELLEDNVVFPFAAIGHAPQDLKYANEPSTVRIGSRNQFRESVTVHRGTPSGHSTTRIGSDGLFMANAHVAHDCVVGDHVVMANCSSLAGHVEIDSHVILGGLTAVHQFCKIGTRAFIGGGTLVGLDVLPYTLTHGHRLGLAGLNSVGLRRAGFTAERLSNVKRMYKEFFVPRGIREESIAALEKIGGEDVAVWTAFIKRSTRGILRPGIEVDEN